MIKLSYTEILGLSDNPTQQEIKKNYKSLCLKLHPDKNGGVETILFIKVKEAYENLIQSFKKPKISNNSEESSVILKSAKIEMLKNGDYLITFNSKHILKVEIRDAPESYWKMSYPDLLVSHSITIPKKTAKRINYNSLLIMFSKNSIYTCDLKLEKPKSILQKIISFFY
jgi:hypothetical protein